MKKLFFCAVILLVLSACHSKPVKKAAVTDSVAVYKVPDEQIIDKIVHEAYASVSFKAGQKPDYDSIKKYFIPQAKVINFESDSAEIMGIDQFIYVFRTFVETDTVRAYSEKELYGKTEQFGRIAERISTYKSETIDSDTTDKKGVNSFQLIKTNSGWKISSMIRDVESPALKIPRYYLSKHYTDSVAKIAPKPKRWIPQKQVND